MQENVKADYHETRSRIIQQFLNTFGKHFTRCEVKLTGEIISIKVEQLCDQDIKFLSWLNKICSDMIGINVARSGKGLKIFVGIPNMIELGIITPELDFFQGDEFKNGNNGPADSQLQYVESRLYEAGLLHPKAENDGKVTYEDEFKAVSAPLIQYLKKYHHPHTTCVVDLDSAEIHEGIKRIKIDENLNMLNAAFEYGAKETENIKTEAAKEKNSLPLISALEAGVKYAESQKI